MGEENGTANVCGNEPVLFKELPKEEQKALRKEFAGTTKADKKLIIFAVVMGIVTITIAICGLVVENWILSGSIFPGGTIVILVAMNEERFVKWLEAEKNIVTKRKK